MASKRKTYVNIIARKSVGLEDNSQYQMMLIIVLWLWSKFPHSNFINKKVTMKNYQILVILIYLDT